MSANMLGQFALALQSLDWNDLELEVKVAGTLKNDKFIVIKPVKEKLVCNPDPELKQKHPYNA